MVAFSGGGTPLAWALNGGHKDNGTAVRYSQVKGTAIEGFIQVHFWPLNDDPDGFGSLFL